MKYGPLILCMILLVTVTFLFLILDLLNQILENPFFHHGLRLVWQIHQAVSILLVHLLYSIFDDYIDHVLTQGGFLWAPPILFIH